MLKREIVSSSAQAAQEKLIIDDIILTQIDWSACARDLYMRVEKSR